MWPFYAHTVIVLISQLLSRSNCHLSIPKRSFFNILSPGCRREKCLRKSNLATTSHTPCTFVKTHLNELRLEGGVKNTTPAVPYGQSRAGSYARTYNLPWRQTICRRRGDAAAVYYGCLYPPVSIVDTDDTVHMYTNSRRAA